MMRIVNQDVATFNATLRQRNLGGIIMSPITPR